jgi:CRP/FNR family transcriptional regulator, cyclic AMP receptor protein
MSGPNGAVEMLSKVDLFSALSGRQLKKIASLAKEVHHAPGHVVAQEGEGGLGFHLILSGTAEVATHGKGVRKLGPGDYFGEISMIDGRPRSATVTAIDSLGTLVVPHLIFEELVSHEPEFSHSMLKVLCARLREVESRD